MELASLFHDSVIDIRDRLELSFWEGLPYKLAFCDKLFFEHCHLLLRILILQVCQVHFIEGGKHLIQVGHVDFEHLLQGRNLIQLDHQLADFAEPVEQGSSG